MATQGEVLWKDRKHFMWWPLSFQCYEIRNGRLYQRQGLLNTTLDELLLYRVTDLTLKQSLAQRIFGTGTILLATRGDSTGMIKLENVKNPVWVRDLISQEVEQARIHYQVVGREFLGHSHGTAEMDQGHGGEFDRVPPDEDPYY